MVPNPFYISSGLRTLLSFVDRCTVIPSRLILVKTAEVLYRETIPHSRSLRLAAKTLPDGGQGHHLAPGFLHPDSGGLELLRLYRPTQPSHRPVADGESTLHHLLPPHPSTLSLVLLADHLLTSVHHSALLDPVEVKV